MRGAFSAEASATAMRAVAERGSSVVVWLEVRRRVEPVPRPWWAFWRSSAGAVWVTEKSPPRRDSLRYDEPGRRIVGTERHGWPAGELLAATGWTDVRDVRFDKVVVATLAGDVLFTLALHASWLDSVDDTLNLTPFECRID